MFAFKNCAENRLLAPPQITRAIIWSQLFSSVSSVRIVLRTASTYSDKVLNRDYIQVPPLYTEFRPNDQASTNGLFRWQYDVQLHGLTDNGDFRSEVVDPDPALVCAALLLACDWLDNHVETGTLCN